MIKILGIKINNADKKTIIKKIYNCLNSNRCCFITTPNPEIILEAQQNEELFYILNKANISLADGFGLKLGAKLLNKKVERYTGSDLSKDLLKLAEEKKKKVLILNWIHSLSSNNEIKNSIKKKYPNLNFLVIDSKRDKNININWQKINNFKPHIMLVNFGSYYQEKFIYLNKHKIPSLKIAVGIGGALDFITKKITRAPYLMRYLGLEWLFRLYKQPQKRFKRIFNAIFVFTYKLFIWKFIHPFKYRDNVACLLYKREEGINKILIVERKDEKNHWQLPQGGTDGLSLKEGAKKEISEELNLDFSDFIIVHTKKHLHHYNVNKWPKNFRQKIKIINGYKGQKQGLAIAKFIGNKNKIKINYFDHRDLQWIDEDKIVNKVHKHRKEATRIFLKEFKKYIKNLAR